MKTKTTTTTAKFVTAEELTAIRNRSAEFNRLVSAPIKTATEKATSNPLEEIKTLLEKRNALVLALSVSATVQEEFNGVVADLCDRLAFLSVKKALEFKQANPTNMPSSALAVIDDILARLFRDYATFKAWNVDNVSLGDGMPLYDLAYFTAWKYLSVSAPLGFDDIVFTRTKKNGDEVNYTLYQYIKHEVHKDIRAWSTTESADLKKMYYLLGYTDDGKQVTTSKRPKTDITDIDLGERKAFLEKYDLTARQQEVLLLHLCNQTTADISVMLNISVRLVQMDLKTAKFIIAQNNPYIKA